jgi:hypothetical protein
MTVMAGPVEIIELPEARNVFRRALHDSFHDFYGYFGNEKMDIDHEVAVDYISGVMHKFIKTEKFYVSSENKDVSMSAMVKRYRDAKNSKEEKIILNHIGDLALFVCGMFPEYLLERKFWSLYVAFGSSSYHNMYEFFSDEMFRMLACNFENYVETIKVTRDSMKLDDVPENFGIKLISDYDELREPKIKWLI